MEYSNGVNSALFSVPDHSASPSAMPTELTKEAEAQNTKQELAQNDTGSVGTTSPVTDSQNQVDFFA